MAPRVAIMNNGPSKGGDPLGWKNVKGSPGLEDLWQLHFALAGIVLIRLIPGDPIETMAGERGIDAGGVVLFELGEKIACERTFVSSFVSSILLWLMPCRLWTNIITVGTAARATSAGAGAAHPVRDGEQRRQ